MFGAHAIEHGSSRTGRWLRERRFRFTLWIAAVEGLLYLFHALHWWAAVALALIAVGFWWYVARGNRSDTLREVGVDLRRLAIARSLRAGRARGRASAIAIGVIALLAIAALIFLFTERPK